MRRSRSPSVLLVALLAVLSAVACENTLAPEKAVGVYALTAVRNNQLPTELYRTDFVIVRVYADTLRLFADGTATIATVRSVESRQQGIPGSPSGRDVLPAHFQINGERVEITFDCPANADCAAGPHLIGVPSADGLDVNFVLANNAALSYKRLPVGA